jgi:hypothetical protein
MDCAGALRIFSPDGSKCTFGRKIVHSTWTISRLRQNLCCAMRSESPTLPLQIERHLGVPTATGALT